MEDKTYEDKNNSFDENIFTWPEDWSGEPHIPEVDTSPGGASSGEDEDEWTTVGRRRAITSKPISLPLLPAPEIRNSFLPLTNVQDTGDGDEGVHPDDATQPHGSIINRDVPSPISPSNQSLHNDDPPPVSQEQEPLRRSTRERRPPPTFNYDQLGVPDSNAHKYMGFLATAEDNLTYREATTGPEKDKWIEAINQELASLSENHV